MAELTGLSKSNPSTQPYKWKWAGKIFAINHNGVDYYPDYGLDPDTGYRPRKSLAEILRALSPHRGDWDTAFWFEAANSYLGGKGPKSLLAHHPDKVLDAAKDDALGVAHG